jgi:histidinol phosphatase-like PHP family hydrolase
MAIVRDYHRQNMFLAQDPRVDVIAHPWWWRTKFTGACKVPVPFRWLDDFSIIPRSMHDEFGAAAREHGKLVEINASNMTTENYSPRWHEQYTEYLVGLKEAGCRFAMGSDSHSPDYRPRPQDMVALLEAAGFTEDDFWAGPDA